MNAQLFDFPASDSRPVDWTTAIIVDNFAGGGGASTGIEQALGRHIDKALNHDAAAIAVHKANHPHTQHFCQSIYSADPLDVTEGKPVLLGWFSPDCKHFSKAKGGKPVDKNIRGLANVVVHWAERIGKKKIKVFMVENVEEFLDWGPLIKTEKGWMPDRARKGEDFQKWCAGLRKAGATAIEWRVLKACDYGAPTIRKRLFVIIRFDGEPIVWPAATHGSPKSAPVQSGFARPWRTAAECIDWSIPCPSIFERSKDLKDATCRRIAAGVMRYVVNAQRPFIVPLTHQGSANRLIDLDQPMPTVTGANRGEMALVEPFVIPITHTKNGGTGRPLSDPLATITTAKGGEFALIAPHITKFRTGAIGHGLDEPLHTVTANSFIKRPGGAAPLGLVAATLVGCGGRAGQSRPRGIDEPIATATAKADLCVATATLVAPVIDSQYGNSTCVDADTPLPTVTAGGSGKQALVAAFLAQHNSGFYEGSGRSADMPVSTVTSSGSQQGVVTSHLIKLRGTCADGQPVDEPMPTITAGGMHVGEVRAFLLKYYGTDQDPRLDEPLHTITTKDRFGLVTVTIDGTEYVVADIGMRMLDIDELKLAQDFPRNYNMQPVCWYETPSGAKKFGKLPKSHGVAKVGNSVSPAMSRSLVAANLPGHAPMLEAAE